MQQALAAGNASFNVTRGPEIDLQTEHEMFVLDHLKGPVLVNPLSPKIRLFSALLPPPPEGRPQTTESVDLLLPGVAEILSRGLREHRLDKFIALMRRKDFSAEFLAAASPDTAVQNRIKVSKKENLWTRLNGSPT